MTLIDFRTDPSRYRHWRLDVGGEIATLTLDVDPAGSLFPGNELKLNSYDLGVDIELADAVQRLRFEHPEVRAVVIRSGKDNVFCAGANIGALAKSAHADKVNFCKFTNETRLAIEDASSNSGQRYLAAVSGPAAGGGYELAAACDWIMLIDDRRSSVSLPEVPLLAVLPGTGGLTRLTDKRKVRRDRADIFCTTEEGARGQRALDWRLVDEIAPPSSWDERIAERATRSRRHPIGLPTPRVSRCCRSQREISGDTITYPHLRVRSTARTARRDHLARSGNGAGRSRRHPCGGRGVLAVGGGAQLDDAILHLRANEPELGILVFRSEGDPVAVLAADALLETHRDDWLVREIRLYWKRVLKRIDMTSRSLFALIEPGSCFAGTLAELVFAADRTFMFAGTRVGDNRPEATLILSPLNFGPYPMGNGLTRLQPVFSASRKAWSAPKNPIGGPILAEDAAETGSRHRRLRRDRLGR